MEEVVKAYLDCRKRKRKTIQVIEFEMNLEENLYNLYKDLNDNKYEIGKSICFVIEKPKYREVWAAQFRDRIVHHIICNRIADKMTNTFIYDSYACIKGRGTLFGINRVDKFIKSASDNYKHKCYFLQADIKNYFVSIDKHILENIIFKKVKSKVNRELLSKIIWHDPKSNVYLKSHKHLFDLVPPHKSLFNTPKSKGLPIGNLTSQFLGNVYLNELDQYVKRELKIKYYGRYVDDVVLISNNCNELKEKYKSMSEFVESKLLLKFHPNKVILNKVEVGINFCGQIILPYRKYIRSRVVKNVKEVYKNYGQFDNHFEKINSYMGLLVKGNTYKLRTKLTSNVDLKFNNQLTKLIRS